MEQLPEKRHWAREVYEVLSFYWMFRYKLDMNWVSNLQLKICKLFSTSYCAARRLIFTVVFACPFHSHDLAAGIVIRCFTCILSERHMCRYISLTECNSGTTQNCHLDNITIEVKNVTATSGNTGILFSWNIPR
jgi:hypothetical protein